MLLNVTLVPMELVQTFKSSRGQPNKISKLVEPAFQKYIIVMCYSHIINCFSSVTHLVDQFQEDKIRLNYFKRKSLLRRFVLLQSLFVFTQNLHKIYLNRTQIMAKYYTFKLWPNKKKKWTLYKLYFIVMFD